jgi:hypothetical protein
MCSVFVNEAKIYYKTMGMKEEEVGGFFLLSILITRCRSEFFLRTNESQEKKKILYSNK